METMLIKNRDHIGGYSWISDSLFDIQSNLSHTEFRTFLCLIRHVNKDGECFPSLNTIADKCEMSKTTVIKNLKDLAKKGLIEIKRRVIEKNGRCEFTSNLYKIKNFIMKKLGKGSTDEIPGSKNSVQGSKLAEQKGINKKGINNEELFVALENLRATKEEKEKIKSIVLSSKKKINNLENYIKGILVNIRKKDNSKQYAKQDNNTVKTKFHNFEQASSKYTEEELFEILMGDKLRKRKKAVAVMNLEK